MVDPATTKRMFYWALFCLLSATIIFVRLLPLDLTAGRLPGADWTIAIAFAWVLRRPNFVPVLLFAVILFMNDMLFMRPPGLWTGLGVIGLEFLRGRAQFTRELPFLFEWALVSAVILAMILANRLILGIFVIGQPGFALDSLLFVMTIAAYPVAVFISSMLLGVRQVAPGATDQYGHRI